MRSAEGRDATLGLHLAGAGSVRRDHDVAREHQLYPDRVGEALHGRDQRLGAASSEPEGIDVGLWQRFGGRDGRRCPS